MLTSHLTDYAAGEIHQKTAGDSASRAIDSRDDPNHPNRLNPALLALEEVEPHAAR